jgi:hypothetical protein
MFCCSVLFPDKAETRTFCKHVQSIRDGDLLLFLLYKDYAILVDIIPSVANFHKSACNRIKSDPIDTLLEVVVMTIKTLLLSLCIFSLTVPRV